MLCIVVRLWSRHRLGLAGGEYFKPGTLFARLPEPGETKRTSFARRLLDRFILGIHGIEKRPFLIGTEVELVFSKDRRWVSVKRSGFTLMRVPSATLVDQDGIQLGGERELTHEEAFTTPDHPFLRLRTEAMKEQCRKLPVWYW